MIEFTSIIPLSEDKTPLSLDWANKNFDITNQGRRDKHYIVDYTKSCCLSWFMNEDGSDYWELKICLAMFKVKYTEEVDYLLRTFCVNVKRKEILDE